MATWTRWSSAVDQTSSPGTLRSYQRDDFVFDPIHYQPLLEKKTGALDQAAPLQGWELPDGVPPRCAGCWNPAWDEGASGSSSRCCGS